MSVLLYMGRIIVRSSWLLVFLTSLPLLAQERSTLPAWTIPDGFGVNIHFTRAEPGELEALAASGNRFIRMDFVWQAVERQAGEYTFDAYDRLVADMSRLNIRILFILDYTHRSYDDGLPPHTAEGRLAFARFAAAAVKQYAGKGILWEIWNEPNIRQFWKPQPNVMDYCRLAHVTIDAIREADPDAFIVGPASSTFPWEFFETMGQQGLLKRLDAVTVHPYRQTNPETAEQDYARLRLLLHKYVPDKRLPILSGEWGYSTAWRGMTEEKQAHYIVRQRLMNLACDVPLSIWYDWRDDGLDPKEPEHHFGTVYRDFKLKPSYVAAKQLSEKLKGYEFVRRVAGEDDRDWMLLFRKGQDSAIAAWTTTGHPRRFEQGDVAIDLKPMPEIRVLPNTPGLTSWRPARNVEVIYAGTGHVLELDVHNPLPDEFRGTVRVRVDGETLAQLPVHWRGGAAQRQRVPLTLHRRDKDEATAVVDVVDATGQSSIMPAAVKLLVANPLQLSVPPPIGRHATAIIVNPSGAPYEILLRLNALDVAASSERLLLGRGQTHAVVHFDMKRPIEDTRTVFISALDREGRTVLRTQSLRWVRTARTAPDVNWQAVLEGDAKVAAHANCFAVTSAATEPAPQPGLVKHVELQYQFADGWRFAMLQPPKDQRGIGGKPKVVGMWVRGDGSRNTLRCRFVDATGQTFQPDYGAIDWTGWKWVTIPLDGTSAGHWGGADDGVVHYPIRWDSVALVDNMNVEVNRPLSLRFAGFAVGYE